MKVDRHRWMNTKASWGKKKQETNKDTNKAMAKDKHTGHEQEKEQEQRQDQGQGQTQRQEMELGICPWR